MKLVLFDIDGTLLWTDGAGRRAIQRALLDEAGTAGPIETYRFDGKTDPQIVRDLLSLAGYADADNASVIQAVCRRYVEHLRTELERPTQTTRLMVGIAVLLVALEPHEADRRALVGLLTGNVAPGAALKLRSAGLDPARFRVGAYGSDSALRAALVRAGATLDFHGVMIDRRFDRGRTLEERDEVLRLREFRPADGTPVYGVLEWKGPPSQRGRYRHRAETEARVAAPDSVV